jgi:hypothetical protein
VGKKVGGTNGDPVVLVANILENHETQVVMMV